MKPEKKETYKPTDEQIGNGAYYDLREIKGYNQACDDWEAWLKETSSHNFLKAGKFNKEKYIKFAEKEIKEWRKFLENLKKGG